MLEKQSCSPVCLGKELIGILNTISNQNAPQLAPRNSHPATRTPQLAPRNSHPATRTPQLAPRTPQLAPRNSHPATRTPQLAPRTPQLAPRNSHPATRTPQRKHHSKRQSYRPLWLGKSILGIRTRLATALHTTQPFAPRNASTTSEDRAIALFSWGREDWVFQKRSATALNTIQQFAPRNASITSKDRAIALFAWEKTDWVFQTPSATALHTTQPAMQAPLPKIELSPYLSGKKQIGYPRSCRLFVIPRHHQQQDCIHSNMLAATQAPLPLTEPFSPGTSRLGTPKTISKSVHALQQQTNKQSNKQTSKGTNR
jgi:hypothetical protein